MLKLFSISFSFLILIQSFGISIADIAQIDELIEHAQFHNKQYGDNVLVFISKHYGALKAEHEKEHQEEKEDHEKLPFNHQNFANTTSAFVLYPQNSSYSIELTEFKTHYFYYNEPSSSLHLEGFFHPPRQS